MFNLNGCLRNFCAVQTIKIPVILDYFSRNYFRLGRILVPLNILSLSLSLSLRFNGHFPGEPGLAGVY